MDTIDILGFVAAVLTTSAFLPQVYKTWKTKSAESLSLSMLIIFISGVFCWLAYGFFIKSQPVIWSNIITAISGCMLIYFKLTYKN